MKLQIKKHWQTLIILLGIFILFSPPIDPDFGWHYKYGEYMVQNRDFLRENIFSYTMPDYKWADSYWIPQIIMYGVYSLSEKIGVPGDISVGLVLSAFISIVFLQILKKSRLETWQIVTGFLLLVINLTRFGISVRPLLFSTIFMLFLIHVILHKPKNIKYLPLLFLVWANSHADFTLGLFVLGVYNIQLLLSQGIKKENLTTHIASLICIIITIINPYGMFLWETLLKETHPLQYSNIGEWMPPNIKAHFVAISLTPALILVSIFGAKEKKKNMWLYTCTLLFFILFIRVSYFGRHLILLGIFPLLDFLKETSIDIKKLANLLGRENKIRIDRHFSIIVGACAVVVFGDFIKNIYIASSEERWAKTAGYPYEEVQQIKKEQPKGKLFNEYDWGGYLIWKLPEYKTFIDGRMPSWRDENGYSAFEEYLSIKKNPPYSTKKDNTIVILKSIKNIKM